MPAYPPPPHPTQVTHHIHTRTVVLCREAGGEGAEGAAALEARLALLVLLVSLCEAEGGGTAGWLREGGADGAGGVGASASAALEPL